MVKNDWSCLRKLAIAIGVIAVVLAVVLSASAVIDFLQRPVGLETTNGNQNPYMAKTELLYFWANILMFLVNLGLLLAALVTFVAVSRQLTVTQNQQWADIVLKLDERFEATDFAAERNQAEAFMDTIEEAVKRKLNISKDDVLLPNEKVFKQMLVEIQTIVDAKIPDNNLVAGYNAAFKAVNFCETLGFLEARGFIRFDDIEQIYGGWIQKVYLAMEGEVRAVRTKRGDPQILINFSNIGLQSWKTRLIREGQVSQAIALVTQLSKSQQT